MLTQREDGVIEFDPLRCCQCGVCLASCKPDALTFKILRDGLVHISVDKDKCTQCGFCARVCPSQQLPKDRLTEANISAAKDIHLTHSADDNIRWMASSGGTARTLIGQLLQKQHVDATYSLFYPENNGLRISGVVYQAALPFPRAVIPTGSEAEGIWITTPPKLERIPCSLYRPILWGKNLAVRNRNWKRVLLIGLPCQIKAASALLRYYLPKTEILKIAIMCRKQKTLGHTKAIKRFFRGNDAPDSSVFYRGFGWPGKSGFLHNGEIEFLNYFFHATCWVVPACRLCSDCLAACYADITLGDPWGIESPSNNPLGSNLTLVWTEAGREMMKVAADSLVRTPCSLQDAIRSLNFPMIRNKEAAFHYYLFQQTSLRNRISMGTKELMTRVAELEMGVLGMNSPLLRLQQNAKTLLKQIWRRVR